LSEPEPYIGCSALEEEEEEEEVGSGGVGNGTSRMAAVFQTLVLCAQRNNCYILPSYLKGI
jgi:hypothetical protein